MILKVNNRKEFELMQRFIKSVKEENGKFCMGDLSYIDACVVNNVLCNMNVVIDAEVTSTTLNTNENGMYKLNSCRVCNKGIPLINGSKVSISEYYNIRDTDEGMCDRCKRDHYKY